MNSSPTRCVLALFLVGCGAAGEKKADAGSPDAKDADKKTDAKSADERNDEPREATLPEGTSFADAACGTYVTEADIKRACAVDTEHEVTHGEGNMPLNTCARKFRGPDERSISFKLAVHESVAKVSSIPWKEGAIGIPDLGDAAHAYVENKGGQFDWHTVEVRTGEQILYLRSINAIGAPPLCTTEQLADVAREAFARLPAAG